MNLTTASGLELSASVILTCAQVATQLGADPALLESWVSRVQWHSLETGRIDQPQITELLELMQLATGRSDLAFLLGEAYCFDFSPAVSMYLNSLDCLRTLQADLGLVKDFFCSDLNVEVKEIAEGVCFTFAVDESCIDRPDEALFNFALVAIIAFCKKEILFRFAGAITIHTFHFRQQAPENIEDFREHLGPALVFNSTFDGFILPHGALDYPVKRALKVLVEKARDHMRSVIAAAPPRISLAEKILHAFTEKQELISLPIQSTAAHFNLSERTLQRKLQGERVTFFELQEQSRQAIACKLLNAGHSTEQVAEILGFSDRRSFCRAFKRWFDMTPRQFLHDSNSPSRLHAGR